MALNEKQILEKVNSRFVVRFLNACHLSYIKLLPLSLISIWVVFVLMCAAEPPLCLGGEQTLIRLSFDHVHLTKHLLYYKIII